MREPVGGSPLFSRTFGRELVSEGADTISGGRSNRVSSVDPGAKFLEGRQVEFIRDSEPYIAFSDFLKGRIRQVFIIQPALGSHRSHPDGKVFGAHMLRDMPVDGLLPEPLIGVLPFIAKGQVPFVGIAGELAGFASPGGR